MKNLLFILFLSIIIISGCATNGENNASQDKTNQPNQEDKDSLKTKKVINGVEYSLSINGNNFDLDDEIIVIGTVKNVSNQPVNYIGYNGCDNGIDVSIPIPDYQSYFLEKEWDEKEVRACTEAIENHVLEPEETIEERNVFIPKMNIGKKKGMDVPTGEYKAKLTFQRGEIDSAAKYHQTIELALHVNGSKNTLIEQNSETVGMENEAVKRWKLDAKSSSVKECVQAFKSTAIR